MDGTASLARNVAIFLDMENLYGGHRNDVGAVPLGRLVREIEQIVKANGFGRRTAIVRAYANWGNPEMGGYRRESMEHGIKPVQIFSFDKNVKNAADIELCIDVLQVAQESPWVEVFVIATGDGGFIPLVRRLHGLNKYVVVVSTNAPAAGLVNSMLKSVADEYHQIDVLPVGAAAVAPKALVELKTPPKTVAKAAAKPVAKLAEKALAKPVVVKAKTKAKAQSKTAVPKVLPAAQVLRSTIINLAKNNPDLMIDGQVNASGLGQLLRKTWPNIKYTNYDTKTLSGFVEKHCGMVARRPVPKQVVISAQPQAKERQALPKKSIQVIQASTEQEYLAAVRHFFTEGGLGSLIVDQKENGMSLDHVSVMLRSAIHGLNPADAGIGKLNVALQHALEGTNYYVVQTEDKKMAVVHSSYLGAAIRLRPTVIQPQAARDVLAGSDITTQ